MNIEKINVGGNLYDVCDTNARAMISDEYNSATQYSAGDYCIWENTLKKANKSTTGTFDSTAWDDTNLVEAVGELNQNMSFKPSMLSSAGIYFYVAMWSGNVIAGQTVNFGSFNIPEGKNLIAMFLTPKATLHISMSYYNGNVYAYSETFTGKMEYDVLMILSDNN